LAPAVLTNAAALADLGEKEFRNEQRSALSKRRWLTMHQPQWPRVEYGPIDYQDLYYYSAPKRKALASLDEVDREILKTYAKLGLSLRVENYKRRSRPNT
jgi:Fe-S cluster assembly scaffold protein SufB